MKKKKRLEYMGADASYVFIFVSFPLLPPNFSTRVISSLEVVLLCSSQYFLQASVCSYLATIEFGT